MTTVQPPGPAQPSSQADPSAASSPLSWEGDKMFNIYIYDYCFKRGFRKTAHELLAEAEIPPESTPPINARQGLLFEWWSVFWVLFTAKANGNGTEEAMLYTQHQAHQAAQRQRQQQLPQNQLPLGQITQPTMQQPPMGRLLNGVPRPGPGPMPNGIGPSGMQQGPGGPTPFMMGPTPQPNGIPGPSGPLAPGAPPQPQNFLTGQRQPLGGAPQRGPNGNGPFPSPTMTHSPQNSGGAPGQQQLQHPQQPHSQAPMAQLGGPSPRLTNMHRGMLPPGNSQGMNPMNPVQQQGNTPTPSYQQLNRPPSRSGTPGQGGMMNPSPSLTARQPMGGMMQMGGQDLNQDIMKIPHATFALLKQEIGLGDKELPSLTMNDKQKILMSYRARIRKFGQAGADNATAGPSNPMMQPPNQQQRNPAQQQRNKRNSTSPGEEHETLPRNESSPPAPKRMRRSPMEQPPMTPVAYGNPGQQPQQGGPVGQQQPPQMGMGQAQNMMMMRGTMGGHMGGSPMNGVPNQPGQPQMGMNLNLNMGGQQMGVPQMGNAMNPGMVHPGGMNMQMQQQQQQQQQHLIQAKEAHYRQSLHSLHRGNMPQGGLNSVIPGNAGSPASSDPSFNPGGLQGRGPGGGGPQFNTGVGLNNQMGQNKPMGMMPPPSPANGPPKDQNGANKDNKNPNNPSINNGQHPGSPRNPPNSGQTPNAGGTAPATPGPGGPGQNQSQQNQNPNQINSNQGQGNSQLQNNQNPGQGNMAPSPSSILGGPPMNAPSMGQPPSVPSAGDMFSNEFIQSVAGSLDDFDPSLFRPDGDINFERDFGQWFNPDDIGGPLDMK